MPLVGSMVCCVLAGYLISIPASAAIVWTEIQFGGSTITLQWPLVLAGGVGVTFVYVAWCAFYLGIKHYQELEEHRSRLLASEALAREAQLRALHYQLQPRFLFNTLNAISTLVLDNKPRIATQMIAKLAGFLRTSLDSTGSYEISLAEEIALTEEYLAIERVRFGHRLEVTCDLASDAAQANVPRFLLQPLVENAIRHGISQLTVGGRITISAHHDGKLLRIEVGNQTGHNVTAHVAAAQEGGSAGLGLSNTRQRLRQMYGEAATLETIQASADSILVRIVIPFRFLEVNTLLPSAEFTA